MMQETNTLQLQKNNVVFIGRKPVSSYVHAVLRTFAGGCEEVKIQARGRFISQAVDISQIICNRILPDVTIGNVALYTDEIVSEDGRIIPLSAIQIVLFRSSDSQLSSSEYHV